MTTENQETREVPKKKWKGTVAIAVGLFIFLIMGTIGTNLMENDRRESRQPSSLTMQISAERACKNAVGDQLKAPATAEYQITRSIRSGRGWQVTGTVDAENSFGAKIRNTWTCSASETNGTWSAYAVIN